jgi:hypothetical protein
MPTNKFKDHPENSADGAAAKAKAVDADKGVSDQVADAIAQEQEQGFRGVEVDPTPNEAYTLAGVTSGQPTPETDGDAALQAREGQREAERKAAGVGGQ